MLEYGPAIKSSRFIVEQEEVSYNVNNGFKDEELDRKGTIHVC